MKKLIEMTGVVTTSDDGFRDYGDVETFKDGGTERLVYMLEEFEGKRVRVTVEEVAE